MGYTYIIADIHGCADAYFKLLKAIDLSPDDDLFVLGDAMDRGPEPMKVILDLMSRENACYILGNHDMMFLNAVRKLLVDLTEENASKLTADDLLTYYSWIEDGGEITMKQFRRLPKEQQADILDFLSCCPSFETVAYGDRLYILTHAGIDHFDPQKELDAYDPMDFLWARTDYTKKYFPGDRIFLVSGHTPTPAFRTDKAPLVYTEHNHIAIDCGCVFGGNLAAYCIETGEATYVQSETDRQLVEET